MSLPFIKMQAQGNDFVVLDGRNAPLPEPDEAFVRRITERRYGIGCDQLLVVLPDDDTDGALRIFNNDGSEAENCGNGLRCVGWLLMRDAGADSCRIRLHDRIVRAERTAHGARVHMGPVRIVEQAGAHVDVELGNPHRVFFEATEDFPRDRNIEIVSGRAGDHVWIDIIERGAGRTLACGSGACATAAAIWTLEGDHPPQTIHMPGGEVRISGTMDDIVLEGPVALVFRGDYRI